MPPVEAVVGTTIVVVAAVLLLSGSTKLGAPRPISTTLAKLGVLRARPVALVIGVLELLLAAVVVMVGGLVAAVGLGFFGLGIAVVGTRALLLGDSIECNCFGANSSQTLGWAQLAQLPLWFGSALLLLTNDHPFITLDVQLAMASLAACLAALFMLRTLRPMWLASSELRTAIARLQ